MERVLDRGEWIEQPDGRRLLWIAEDRKPWTAVVKRTGNGEVYLQSYRRAQLDEVMRMGGGAWGTATSPAEHSSGWADDLSV